MALTFSQLIKGMVRLPFRLSLLACLSSTSLALGRALLFAHSRACLRISQMAVLTDDGTLNELKQVRTLYQESYKVVLDLVVFGRIVRRSKTNLASFVALSSSGPPTAQHPFPLLCTQATDSTIEDSLVLKRASPVFGELKDHGSFLLLLQNQSISFSPPLRL